MGAGGVLLTEIPQSFALKAQLAAFGGGEPVSSFLEIRPLSPVGRQSFVPVRELGHAVEEVLRLRDSHEVFVSAAPRTARRGTSDAVARVWTLWADCDSPEAVARLRAFKPLPSIVVASGGPGRLHGYWPLHVPLEPAWARGANLRIAKALGSDRACVDSGRVMRAIASVNRKRGEPAPVRAVRLELDVFRAGEVVGGLPDDDRFTPKAPRPERPEYPAGPAALEPLVRTVASAQPGNRNCALHWAACRAAEDVDAGKLDEAEARGALRLAALAAGLEEDEIAATLGSALDRRVAA